MAGESDYRLAPAFVLRLAGAVTVVLGAVWLLVVLAGASAVALVVLGAITVGLLAVLAIVAWRPPRLLRLTDSGYAVAWVRGAGVRKSSWDAVESVEVMEIGSDRAIVFSLTGGRRTCVPLSLLGRRRDAARHEVYTRLNAAHGYRPLRR